MHCFELGISPGSPEHFDPLDAEDCDNTTATNKVKEKTLKNFIFY
tara:strand:+ start:615 stop:749 length:135 start_codon:yes stop_codon:yes gene_type:complete